jgi:sec-independent protein translocase protein TatA
MLCLTEKGEKAMLTTFGLMDVPELAIILVLALIIFGPGKLPDIGKSLGKGIAEFKKAADGSETKDQNSNNRSEQKSDEKIEK